MPLAVVSRRPFLALVVLCLIALTVAVLFGRASSSSAEQGQYLHFGGPGSGYLEVADAPALSPASEITIELWLYLTSGSSWPVGSCPGFVGKGYLTSYWLGLDCGSLRLRFYPGGGGSAVSTGVLPTGEWVHLAVTYDGADVKFYINGILDSTVPLISALGANASPLRFGNDANWNFTPIGHVDEVHIWNIVRSQQAIMLDMDPITTPAGGLVGVWNMEGSPNSDVGGFTGSLVGDAVFAGTPITPVPTAEPPYDKGDTTCDHAITPSDAIELLSGMIGVETLSNCVNPLAPTSAGAPADQWWDASSGDGYIEIPHSDALNPTDALSIDLWVNIWSYYSADSLDTCSSLVGKGYTDAYWLGMCSGYLRFYVRDGAPTDASSMQLPLRQWTHLAVTADNTTKKFYINGELVREVSNDSAPLGTNTDPLRIGSDPDYNYQPWAALDDVHIWNVVLTEEQIDELINSPPTPPQPGLVAWYTLDGNAEDTANDHEGGAVGTVEYGNSLPGPYWPDIDCSGLLDGGDILPLVAYLGGVGDAYPVPDGCEAIGSATY